MDSLFAKVAYFARSFYQEQVNENPIFVLGNQKSGTTAIAALVAKLGNLSVTLDISSLYEPTQTKIHKGELNFHEFVKENISYFSKDLIKEPSLTFLYGDIVKEFPNAKFLFIVRDPRDNIRSILNRLSLKGNHKYILKKDFERISPEWKLIIDGTWMGLKGNTYIEHLALRWNRAVATYLQNKESMVLVRYEDFNANKVQVIRKAARDLNVSYINEIENDIDKQYQPKGDGDVDWLDFYGIQNLQIIENICYKYMHQLDYQSTQL